jgi:hypothetical protein
VTDRRADIERQRDRQRRNTEYEDHQNAEGDQERPTARLGFLSEELSVPDSGVKIRFGRHGAVSPSLAVLAVINRHNRVRRSGAGILGIRQRGG